MKWLSEMKTKQFRFCCLILKEVFIFLKIKKIHLAQEMLMVIKGQDLLFLDHWNGKYWIRLVIWHLFAYGTLIFWNVLLLVINLPSISFFGFLPLKTSFPHNITQALFSQGSNSRVLDKSFSQNVNATFIVLKSWYSYTLIIPLRLQLGFHL